MFVGVHLNEDAIRAALDACLCTYLELLPAASPSALCSTHPAPLPDPTVDPWAAWPPISALLRDAEKAECTDADHNHSHADGNCAQPQGEAGCADADDEAPAPAYDGAAVAMHPAATAGDGVNDAVCARSACLDLDASSCAWLLRSFRTSLYV